MGVGVAAAGGRAALSKGLKTTPPPAAHAYCSHNSAYSLAVSGPFYWRGTGLTLLAFLFDGVGARYLCRASACHVS